MKTFWWTTLFVALVFGIGWKSGSLARSAHADGSASGSTSSDPRTEFGHRRGGGGGPLLGSTEEFADQLELTDAQRSDLTQIISATAARIRAQEEAIWLLKHESRNQVLALLTKEQSTRLESLLEERMKLHVAEKVKGTVAWFEAQTEAFDADQLERVEAVLSDYENGKRELFHDGRSVADALSNPTHPAGRDEHATGFELLRDRRDEQLRAIVGDEVVERFQSDRKRPVGRPPFRSRSGRTASDVDH